MHPPEEVGLALQFCRLRFDPRHCPPELTPGPSQGTGRSGGPCVPGPGWRRTLEGLNLLLLGLLVTRVSAFPPPRQPALRTPRPLLPSRPVLPVADTHKNGNQDVFCTLETCCLPQLCSEPALSQPRRRRYNWSKKHPSRAD